MIAKIKHRHQLKAFTLTELLVVLVIVGILVLLALPSLMPLISRTRSVEAKQALKHVHTLEKTYFFEYSKYTEDLSAIGYEQEATVIDAVPGKANYEISVALREGGFIALAKAVVDFDDDGIYNEWEIDENGNLTETVKD